MLNGGASDIGPVTTEESVNEEEMSLGFQIGTSNSESNSTSVSVSSSSPGIVSTRVTEEAQPGSQPWEFSFITSSGSSSGVQQCTSESLSSSLSIPSVVTATMQSASSVQERSLATARRRLSASQHINASVSSIVTSNNVTGTAHQPASSAFDFSTFGSSLNTVQRPIASHRSAPPVYTPVSRGVFLGEDDVQRRVVRQPSRVSVKKEVRIEEPFSFPTRTVVEPEKFHVQRETIPVPLRTAENSEEEEEYWFGFVDSRGGYRPMSKEQEQLYRRSLDRQRMVQPQNEAIPQPVIPQPAIVDNRREEPVQRTPHSGRTHNPRQLMRETNGRQPAQEEHDHRRYRTQRVRVPRFKTGDCFDVFLMKFESYLQRGDVEWEDLGEQLLESIDCTETYKRVRRLKLSVEEQRDPTLMIYTVRSAVVHRVKDEEAERRKLMQMKQDVEESVEEFADRIREVAEYAFPMETDRVINQRMIEALQDGLADTRVSELVCDLRIDDLDFEKVVLLAAKRSKRNRMFRGDIYRDPSSTAFDRDNVFRLTNRSPENNVPAAVQQTPENVPATRPLCSKCGKRDHIDSNCWTSMTCQLCKTLGHIAHQCPRFRQQNSGPQRTMDSRQRPRGNHSGPSRNQGCFECGSPAHRVAQCPVRAASTQCYSCYQFGHRAVECPQFPGNGGAIGGYPAAPGRQ